MNAVVELNPAQNLQVAPPAMNPVQMIALALQQGMPLETLQVLRQMQKEWEADEARKAFVAAMAAFKANPPEIVKDKHVEYTNNRNQTTAYDHATLGSLCAAIIKGLAAHGISHRWETAQQDNRIKVTCVLTHAQGHSESVSLHSAADDSGGKNSIQAIGSAVTYLQRYTLLAATGLAALDQDDDGDAAGKPASNKPIAPADYEDWQKHMMTTAKGGIAKLQEAWNKTAEELRDFATQHDVTWWEATKKAAAKVQP
jgi:hypothetical protein